MSTNLFLNAQFVGALNLYDHPHLRSAK